MSSDLDVAGSDLSPDLAFDILSNRRRRMVLNYLRTNGSEATVKELAREIAAAEAGVDTESLTRKQRKRTHVSIYQSHLPRLAEAGIVEYDEEAGEVRLANRAVELEPYLDPPREDTYPWQTHFLVLAVVSLLLLGASFASGTLPVAIPTTLVSVLVTMALTISALAYYAD